MTSCATGTGRALGLVVATALTALTACAQQEAAPVPQDAPSSPPAAGTSTPPSLGPSTPATAEPSAGATAQPSATPRAGKSTKTTAPIGQTIDLPQFRATVRSVSDDASTAVATVEVCAKGTAPLRVALDSWLRHDRDDNIQIGGVMAGDDDGSTFPYGTGAPPRGADERVRLLKPGECASGTVAFYTAEVTGHPLASVDFISGVHPRVTWTAR